jgi:hypothetical protein
MFHLLLEFDQYFAIYTYSTSRYQFKNQKGQAQVLMTQLYVFVCT